MFQNQKFKIQNGSSLDDIDQLNITIPDGWQVTNVPDPKTMDLTGAKYKFLATRTGNTLHLKREMAIGSLDPVISSNARHLASKQLLILSRPDMLDDGVAEDDVERAIGEGKHSSVRADQICMLRVGSKRGGHIEDCQLWFGV